MTEPSPFPDDPTGPAACTCDLPTTVCERHDPDEYAATITEANDRAIAETTAKKPRRSRRSARAAGSRFEREVADYLRDNVDDRIDRRAKTGAKDKGDIGGVRFGNERVVVECKDTAKMSLQAWLREAAVEAINDEAAIGVVVHKRIGTAHPAEQYVTMTLETFAWMLARHG